MSIIDGILLTLLNAFVCLALPKLVSIILANKNKPTLPAPNTITSQEA